MMNSRLVITFIFTGLAIGLLTTLQLNSEPNLPTAYPGDEIKARENLIKSLMDDQSYLQSRIVTLRKQIEDSQSLIRESSQQNNIELLNNLKKSIGLTSISGEGIEILLNDSPAANRGGTEVKSSELVQAADIRDIINILFSTRAEAISVNQQRIVASSAISSVNTSILINGVYISPPFMIQAVGDTPLMTQRLRESRLLTEVYDRMLGNKITFEIKPRKQLQIPIHNGDLQAKYINLNQ